MWISRDKYMTFSQKVRELLELSLMILNGLTGPLIQIVQVRMWVSRLT